MSSAGNETLERIQREIKENLEKEEEWKRELERMSNGNDIENNNKQKENKNVPKVNGVVKKKVREDSENDLVSSQNVNKFIQTIKTKGVMHRFLKSKGKLVPPPKTNGNFQSTDVISDFTYQPPRVTSETGNLSRNGFIPADVKMRNEVHEFQKRELELRKERRKSQPELMALLKLVDEDENKDEGFPEYSCSSSTSSASEMKSAKSLADLCNTPEEELDAPGTHNLILQFENWKKL